ncbi:MAG: 23S rRNA (uracil(1939)-C(5))-methyltransferase RlmD [Clostridiales bacterium]|nr:23S rRNA (uracil(1939)-C(5))-methyltransferase RlmD [Clostridiales bacterium]
MPDLIEITGMTSNGRGVGRIGGMAVFVAGAVPGDKCTVKITKRKKTFAEGELAEIIEPSAKRTEPVCTAFGKCGGCAMMNMLYEAQLAQKEKIITDALRRIGGFGDFSLDKMNGADNPLRYRNKAIFALKGGKFGFFEGKTHSLVPAEDCFLCPGEFSKIAAAAAEVFDGRIFIRKSEASGKIMAMLMPEGNFDRKKAIEQIRAACGAVESIMLKGEKKPLFGREVLEEQLMGVRFEVSPGSFLQVNPEMTKRLYRCALEFAKIDKSTRLLDLYCGIGTISLLAAKQAGSVVGVELVEDAVKNARKNARKNGIENAEFYAGKVGDIIEKLSQADTVIMDPPRAGSDERTINAIAAAAPERIVYISCDPSTLARDARLFAERGYRIKSAQGFDMFPQTMHVETVCLMSRIEK